LFQNVGHERKTPDLNPCDPGPYFNLMMFNANFGTFQIGDEHDSCVFNGDNFWTKVASMVTF